MPLFLCARCGCYDNTALTSYYRTRHESVTKNIPFSPVCSECETGHWHGQFPKASAEGMYVSRTGYLFREEELLHISNPIAGRVVNGKIVPASRPPKNYERP